MLQCCKISPPHDLSDLLHASMGDTGDDVSYIADLINGNGPDANAQGGRRARHCRRRSTQGRDNTTQQENADQGPENNRGLCTRHVTVPSPSSRAKDEEEGKYNHPSDKSTNKLFHCSTCDVWVPSRPTNWDVHIAGIRHRRHVLSLREHGERGRIVLSSFESDPKPGETSHRFFGKASAAELGFDQGASSSGFPKKHREEGKKKGAERQHNPSPQVVRVDDSLNSKEYSVRCMITEAKSRLLGIYGYGRIYTACIDEIFTRSTFWDAERNFSRLGTPIRLSSELVSLNPTTIDQINRCKSILRRPTDLLCMAYKLKEATRKRQGNPQCAPVTGAVRHDKDQYAASEDFLLPPVVVLEMERTQDRTQDRTEFIAAWLCGLQFFIHALAENPDQVVRLVLIIPLNFSIHLHETLHKGWDRVLSDIENVLLTNNGKLKEVRMYLLSQGFAFRRHTILFPAISRETLDETMKEKIDDASAKFKKKAKETAANKRLAILMSRHPRLGRCSVLQLLPEPAVQRVVEEAVPKQGCVICVANLDNTPDLKFSSSGEWTVHHTEPYFDNSGMEEWSDEEPYFIDELSRIYSFLE